MITWRTYAIVPSEINHHSFGCFDLNRICDEFETAHTPKYADLMTGCIVSSSHCESHQNVNEKFAKNLLIHSSGYTVNVFYKSQWAALISMRFSLRSCRPLPLVKLGGIDWEIGSHCVNFAAHQPNGCYRATKATWMKASISRTAS